MKKAWVKWIVGLTSVASFASLIGYFQQPDQKDNYTNISKTNEQALILEENEQSNIVFTQNLSWDETWFDDPSTTVNTQIITLNDETFEFDESLLTNTSQIVNKGDIVNEGKDIQNGSRRTKTRSS